LAPFEVRITAETIIAALAEETLLTEKDAREQA